jgi:hypothetical protein
MSRAKRLQGAIDRIIDGKDELENLKSEYEDWQGNLPDNLQSSLIADKLDEAIGVFDDAICNIDDAIINLDGLELPQGFGRD